MPLEMPLPISLTLWQESLQWQPNPTQIDQFQTFYEAVVTANQTFNLTRITSPADFWEKHLWDSLSGIAPWLVDLTQDPHLRVVDIGSGAGFPGIPVAIARPDWSITLLEATRKKVTFLQSLPPLLKLSDVTPHWGRAETYDQLAYGQLDHERQPGFDLALIRAVGKATLCTSYGLPLLIPGGQLILYRGQWSNAEEKELVKQLKEEGASLRDIRSFQTPLSHSQRHCVLIQRHES